MKITYISNQFTPFIQKARILNELLLKNNLSFNFILTKCEYKFANIKHINILFEPKLEKFISNIIDFYSMKLLYFEEALRKNYFILPSN